MKLQKDPNMAEYEMTYNYLASLAVFVTKVTLQP